MRDLKEHLWGMQGCNKEGHSPLGIESGKIYQEQEGLLQVHHQQKKIRENVGLLLNPVVS